MKEGILEKLRRLIFGKTIWERLEEVFEPQTVVELKRARVLKEYADKFNVPIVIEIPSLKIQYMYDPLDRKLKEKKAKLLDLLIKEKVSQREREELKKILSLE